MNDPDKLIEEFDSFSDCYDEVVIEHLSYNSHEIVPSMMLSYIVADQPKVLDLGCGTGISSDIFFDHHYEVTGIDISPGMINQAEKRPFKRLLCQSLEEPLPFKAEEFDAVVMLGVLEFIENPTLLFKQVANSLKQNGIIGVTFPMNKPGIDTELIVTSYSEQQITELVNSAGLKIVTQQEFLGYNSLEYTINYTGLVLQKA